MSGTLRRLQREVIKNQCYQRDGRKKAFKDEWEKVHYGIEEANENEAASVKSKKVEKTKQRHFDDGKAYVKHLKAVKSFVESMRNKTSQNKSNTNAKTKVC